MNVPHVLRLKKFWAIVLTPVVLFLVVFFGLDPLVEWRTRKMLEVFQPQYVVTYGDARLQPTKFNYALTQLKVLKQSAGGNREPFLYFDKIQISLMGRELLHLRIVAEMEFDQPKINFIAAHDEKDQQMGMNIPDFSDRLAAVLPLTIDRVQVRNGEVMFTDKTNADFPKVWLHKVEGTLENLATRAALQRGEPTVIAASGTIQDSGQLSLYATTDPLSKGLFFAGRARLEDMDLKEFSKAMASKSGLSVSEGTLDVFAEFDCRAGKLSGGVKPVIKNAKVVQGKPGIGNAIKAVLADTAVKIFSDRVREPDGEVRRAVATVIPISGTIDGPNTQPWPAITGAIRNAFVIGVTEGFERLPPPKSDHPQSGIGQLVDALNKGKAAPKLQPDQSQTPTRQKSPP